ncbi:hypothetical protein ABEB36_011036 [Hypothenemus hampei]|uniref:Uncharacterized protein n=1 Tax=Hypothenemus hampei TaxID=57062 RepID=A0ABD1EFZ4_HYPHA
MGYLARGKHFIEIKPVILKLKDDARNITACKNLVLTTTVLENVLFIEDKFKNLPATISYFGSENNTLKDDINKLRTCIKDLKNVPGDIGTKINPIGIPWRRQFPEGPHH